ncbi:hypothetical protein [Streptacidiphilus jiangxiensis]|uniref:Uncharacterized protein n=1 Tax=Streptacidiphilus jiangxiensis TaxID=235985 RepID=A0A1H7ZP62_STRJI|nr:hypothetical protein [Streptacidiphilus jiangxiensis]SEM60180.1 hypothetical protein SAMN05414137_13662 [Streptacidiphilus jiangxiensis]
MTRSSQRARTVARHVLPAVTGITAGTPAAIVGAATPGHALAAAVVAGLTTTVTTLITAAGRDLVGLVARRITPPSLRHQRWLLRHGHVDGKLTPTQLVEMSVRLHADEAWSSPGDGASHTSGTSGASGTEA